MNHYYELFVLIVFVLIGLFSFKSFRQKKVVTKSGKASKIATEKRTEKLKEAIDKITSYPRFIPFYEWHGFVNGLHPENRKYYLSNGKLGTKPKRWNNDK